MQYDNLANLNDLLQSNNIKSISRYQIQETLGNNVYKAYDERLERLIVLKVLSVQNAADFLQREAQAIARLKHHNIIKIFDFDNDGKYFFIAMEYLDENSLYDQNISQDYVQIAKIIQQIAQGIYHAHQQGIIHRNLKPNNILFQQNIPKICDFGLVKFLDTATHINIIKGSLPYMAPEQILDNAPVDQRTDIYSIGILLYELLACENPLKNITLSNAAATLKQPIKQLNKINPFIPKQLQRICHKCLSYKKRDRYRNAHLLTKDLQLFLEKKQSPTAIYILTTTIIILMLIAGKTFSDNRNLNKKIFTLEKQIKSDQYNLAALHKENKNHRQTYSESLDKKQSFINTIYTDYPIFQKFNWKILRILPQKSESFHQNQLCGKILFNYSLECTTQQQRDQSIDKALYYFDQAAKLNPENVFPLFYSYLACDIHSSKKQQPFLQKIKTFSNEVGFYIKALEIHKKQPEKALSLLEKAKQKNPHFSFIYYLKGKITQRENREKAILYFSKGLQFDPLNPFLLYGRSYLNYQREELHLALQDATLAIQRKIFTAPLWYIQSRVLEKQEKSREALKSIQLAIRMGYNEDYVYFHRLGILRKMGHFSRALQDANTIIKMKPKRIDYYQARAKIHKNLKQYIPALQDYKKVHLADKKNKKVIFKMYEIYNEIGDKAQAQKMFRLLSK